MGDLGGTAIWIALVAAGPLLLLAVTCFVKFAVVLALVRNAIGAPQVPPNLVVTALALLLSIVVMAPVAEKAWQAAKAAEPAQPARTATGPTGPLAQLERSAPPLRAAAGPLKEFLAKHVHDEDRETFVRLTTDLRGAPAERDELLVLAPAFVTSELSEAFVIGVLLLLPFLVLDLLVGLVLAVMGLSSVSPTHVALPLKLLLFVAVDGWRVLAEGLIVGYT